jgi:hypothetical protein
MYNKVTSYKDIRVNFVLAYMKIKMYNYAIKMIVIFNGNCQATWCILNCVCIKMQIKPHFYRRCGLFKRKEKDYKW